MFNLFPIAIQHIHRKQTTAPNTPIPQLSPIVIKAMKIIKVAVAAVAVLTSNSLAQEFNGENLRGANEKTSAVKILEVKNGDGTGTLASSSHSTVAINDGDVPVHNVCVQL